MAADEEINSCLLDPAFGFGGFELEPGEGFERVTGEADFGVVGAEYLGDVAERVFIRSEPRIDREVDAPAHHMLAVVVAWRQS